MSSPSSHVFGLLLSFTYVLSFNVDMVPNSTVKNATSATNATLLGFGNFPNPGLRPIHCPPGFPPPFGFRCINNDVETESPTPYGTLETDEIPVPDPTPYPTPVPTSSPTDTPGLEGDVIEKPTASPSLGPAPYYQYYKYNGDCTQGEVLQTYTSGSKVRTQPLCERECDRRRGNCIAVRFEQNTECTLLKNSVCSGSPPNELNTGLGDGYWTRRNLYQELSGDCGGNHMDSVVFAPTLASCELRCSANFPLCKGISYVQLPGQNFKCHYKTSVCSNPTPGNWRFLEKIEGQFEEK
mmetsp:Transcript_4707/g.7003  ORF Transcript_4707/g.7003 Transcript_4707/m.7003 type:complete len:296 (+) Transcript_4707:123-1010(+)